MPFHLPPISASVSCVYANLNDVIGTVGTTNTNTWSALDGQTGPNYTTMQYAFTLAASVINSMFAGGPYALTPNLTLGTTGAVIVKNWCVWLFIEQLYENRGQSDAGAVNQYQTKIDKVRAEMRRYKTNLMDKLDATPVFAGTPTAPTVLPGGTHRSFCGGAPSIVW